MDLPRDDEFFFRLMGGFFSAGVLCGGLLGWLLWG